MVCYSFPVGLFHSLLHAGLSRRTASHSCPHWLAVSEFIEPCNQQHVKDVVVPTFEDGFEGEQPACGRAPVGLEAIS